MGSHSGHQDGGSEVQGLRTLAGVEQNWIQIRPFNLTSCVTLLKGFNLFPVCNMGLVVTSTQQNWGED